MSAMDNRYPSLEELERDLRDLGLDDLGRTPWDPVMRADGTYPPTPLFYRLYFGIFDKRYRRGGKFNPRN